MHLPIHLRTALLAASLLLAAPSCRTYSTVSTRPLAHQSTTPAGRIISWTLDHPSKDPLAQMGGFLDAAASADAVLKRTPGDTQALSDYGFAVSRVFEIYQQAGLEPWKAPLRCPGQEGDWLFSLQTKQFRGLNPTNFELRPADRYDFKGKLITERALKAGLGAPLIVTSKGIDFTKITPHAQGKTLYYGMTVVLDFKGRDCAAALYDPLATESVPANGHTYPLAADFTAPIALALAELNPGKVELKRMFKPGEFKDSARLAMLQPYDPKKIPVLLIHGLGDSQATWAPMVEDLRKDPTFRTHYQIWFYTYPTGYPYPLMAAQLREKMDGIKKHYPDHKPVVVVGHSMGGMIARSLITDSRMTLWDAFFETPPAQTPLSPETKKILTSALIFSPRTDISRVIFLSASLRGSDMATGLMGDIGLKIISVPPELKQAGFEIKKVAKTDGPGELKGSPSSLNGLNPDNRFLRVVNAIPPVKGIPYHSIIADRGKGGNLNRTEPQSTDGIVPYWSSHIDGAQSELIVPSDHWSNRNPQGIAEVLRILKLHLRGKSASAPESATSTPHALSQPEKFVNS